MAAILRQFANKSSEIVIPINVISREFATKAEKAKGIDRKPSPTINASADSLAAKGFLRPQKAYTPPKDVDQSLDLIVKDVFGETKLEHRFSNLSQKFEFLNACSKKFQHSVPNSLLRFVNSLEDVRNFYKTPVEVLTPLDRMKSMDLPENLHIQYDYVRFHPETDTKFDGVSAFNGRSTIVTGLKYKNKYQGHEEDTSGILRK